MIDKKERKQLKKASAHHSKKHMAMMNASPGITGVQSGISMHPGITK